MFRSNETSYQYYKNHVSFIGASDRTELLGIARSLLHPSFRLGLLLEPHHLDAAHMCNASALTSTVSRSACNSGGAGLTAPLLNETRMLH